MFYFVFDTNSKMEKSGGGVRSDKTGLEGINTKAALQQKIACQQETIVQWSSLSYISHLYGNHNHIHIHVIFIFIFIFIYEYIHLQQKIGCHQKTNVQWGKKI